MHERDVEFEQLMEGVKNGSEEAVRRLLDVYADAVFRSVRRRLHRSLRTRLDSEDFVQAVWASFFAHRSKIEEFEKSEQLVAFLARVASNKVIEECRRYLDTQKHDIKREQRLEAGETERPPDLAAREPSPSAVAMANEQWLRLLEGQPIHYQRIVEMRALGATYEEIARELGMNERNVRRFIQKLSQRMLS